MPQAILFDFDLTLGRPVGDLNYETRQAHLYASVGLPYDEATLNAALQQRRSLVAAGRLPGVVYPQRRREILTSYRQVLKLLGYTGDTAAMAQKLYEGYASLPFVLYDDARATLQTLATRGVRLGVISNHSPTARPLIEACVGDLIPARQILISGEEGVHKPRPTLFKRGAARLGCPPARCVFVGDNLRVDATAAIVAGYCLGIWVDRANDTQTPLPEGVRRITRLSDLIGMF